MSLFYIKGTPGSGKSTVRAALQKLGHEVYDADDDNIGSPYNNETNQKVKYPDETPSAEWYAAHSWRLIPEAIQELHNRAKDKPIFLCGTASNENKVWDLFDHVLFLDVDEATLKYRIANRTNNNYGKASHELELIIKKYREDWLKRDMPGVIVIDATLPVSDVVQSILSKTQTQTK